MREASVQVVVDSWYQILVSINHKLLCPFKAAFCYELRCLNIFPLFLLSQTTWHAEPDIVTACLEVTSVYVPWIDVTSVANDKFLPVVLQLMRNEYARAAAADLLCQVVDKGMEHLDKLQLITRMLVLLRNFDVPLLPSQVTLAQ